MEINEIKQSLEITAVAEQLGIKIDAPTRPRLSVSGNEDVRRKAFVTPNKL